MARKSNKLASKAAGFIEGHPTVVAVGVAAFIVFAGLILFVYLLISGLAEPVQGVYAAF